MIMDLSKVTIADIHIHSKYSRACSKDLSFENLAKWAKIKGLNLLGKGDFTHHKWLEEIKQLREENGLYYYENFPFVLSGEISLIYTKGRGRRVHLVLVAPSIEVVEKINAYLDTKGRRDYDGRPIFKIDCEEFAKQMIAISQDIELIPAHAWTPWFGIFGSKTGFNSLKEAFGEQEKHIHAIETGMSSDPEMNWKLSFLNNKAIVSFSDSHSFWPFRLGREASIFSKIESYQDLIKQIRENSIVGTIETDPAYGKYHWNGHRACNYSSKENNICPVCGDMLTIGVESRVGEIGNQKIDENKNHKFYFKILPLHELISVSISSGLASKKTWEVYNKMIERFGNEFNILLTASREELMSFDEKLADLILKNRAGKLEVKPGYDGEYGKLIVAGKEIGVEEDEPIKTAQKTLF